MGENGDGTKKPKDKVNFRNPTGLIPAHPVNLHHSRSHTGGTQQITVPGNSVEKTSRHRLSVLHARGTVAPPVGVGGWGVHGATWQFMLSSASMSFPRYTSPVLVSHVTMWPSASCRTLMGTPIDILAGSELYSETDKSALRSEPEKAVPTPPSGSDTPSPSLLPSTSIKEPILHVLGTRGV